MSFKRSRIIEAACLCNVGAKRSNNEDNYYFAGKFMNQEHLNLEAPVTMNENLTGDLFFAVFDGMGVIMGKLPRMWLHHLLMSYLK